MKQKTVFIVEREIESGDNPTFNLYLSEEDARKRFSEVGGSLWSIQAWSEKSTDHALMLALHHAYAMVHGNDMDGPIVFSEIPGAVVWDRTLLEGSGD